MPRKPCARQGCFKLLDLGNVYCEDHAVQDKRERDRPADGKRREKPYRRWYSLKAWRGEGGRRLRQLEAEPLCCYCPEHSRSLATVADHVVPHRGDYALFWFGKLQSLCAPCHDIVKQREESRAEAGKVDC